jgi:hypothetical protein
MPRPLYPWGKWCRYPLDRRVSGPQSRSGGCGEEKILACTGIRTPDPRSYTDCAMPAPIQRGVVHCKSTDVPKNMLSPSLASTNKDSKKPTWSRQHCWFPAWFILWTWIWRRQAPPKRRLTFKGKHGVISKKTIQMRLRRYWPHDLLVRF